MDGKLVGLVLCSLALHKQELQGTGKVSKEWQLDDSNFRQTTWGENLQMERQVNSFARGHQSASNT